MKFEKFTVTLSLSVEQVNQLAGLTRLYNDRMVSEGRCPCYTECSCLGELLSSRLTGLLSDEFDYAHGLKDSDTQKKFTVYTHGFAVSLELNDEQREKVTELAALYNEHCCYTLGRHVEFPMAGKVLLAHAVDYAIQSGLTLDEQLEHDVQHWRDNVRRDKEKAEANREAGDVPTRNPSPEATPDEAEKKPKAVSNEAAFDDDEKAWLFDNHCVDCAFHSPDHECCDDTKWFCYWSLTRSDDHALGEMEPETVPNAEEEAPGDRESEPDGEEDFLSLTPLPCSYPHNPTVQDTPYDPARYEGDAYECGGCVVENPETLAFVDALTEALCR